MITPHHQIYNAYPQQYLLKHNIVFTEEQQMFAKQSLIEKHKIANGIQQLLFCKKVNLTEEEFISLNQKNLIQNQRKKYVDFIKKNYNQKIGEELFNLNKLKSKIREFQAKTQEEKQREKDQNQGRNLMEQDVRKRKREADIIAKAGRKKIKLEKEKETVKQEKGKGKPKGKGKIQQKEGEKIVKGAIKKEELKEQFSNDLQSNQSLDLDLLNSLNDEGEEEEFNDYE